MKNQTKPTKKILVVIPARGGSKGIPRKNIKLLAGKPMIAYVIESTKKVKGIDRIIVSTEDKEIAQVAKQYNAEVPFIRPMALATDEVATLPVLQHAINALYEQEGYQPDYVLTIYPTSPLLKWQRIQEAVDLALRNDADSVLSGTYDKGHFWSEMEGGYERLYPRKLENRQFSKPLFKENGAIYLTKTEILTRQLVADKMIPLIMEEENVDIDEPKDFERAQKILQELKK